MIEVVRICSDDNRHLYMDKEGYKYVDINTDETNPHLYTFFSTGKINTPIKFRIVKKFTVRTNKIRVKHTWDQVYGWLDIRWGNRLWAITWDDEIIEEFWIDEENIIKISEFINNAKGEENE